MGNSGDTVTVLLKKDSHGRRRQTQIAMPSGGLSTFQEAVRNAFGAELMDQEFTIHAPTSTVDSDAAVRQLRPGASLWEQLPNGDYQPPARERISFVPHPKTLTMAGDYEYFSARGHHPFAFALAELVDNALRATKGPMAGAGAAGSVWPKHPRATGCLPGGEAMPNIVVEYVLGSRQVWRRPLAQVQDDLESRYVRAAGAKMEFELEVPGKGAVEGVLWYFPYQNGAETVPRDQGAVSYSSGGGAGPAGGPGILTQLAQERPTQMSLHGAAALATQAGQLPEQMQAALEDLLAVDGGGAGAAVRKELGEGMTGFTQVFDGSRTIAAGDVVRLSTKPPALGRVRFFAVPQAGAPEGVYATGFVTFSGLPAFVHGPAHSATLPLRRVDEVVAAAALEEFAARERGKLPSALRLEPLRLSSGRRVDVAVGDVIPETTVTLHSAAGQRLTRTFLQGQKVALRVQQRLVYMGARRPSAYCPGQAGAALGGDELKEGADGGAGGTGLGAQAEERNAAGMDPLPSPAPLDVLAAEAVAAAEAAEPLVGARRGGRKRQRKQGPATAADEGGADQGAPQQGKENRGPPAQQQGGGKRAKRTSASAAAGPAAAAAATAANEAGARGGGLAAGPYPEGVGQVVLCLENKTPIDSSFQFARITGGLNRAGTYFLEHRMLPDLPPGCDPGGSPAPVVVWCRTVLYATAGAPVRFELRGEARAVLAAKSVALGEVLPPLQLVCYDAQDNEVSPASVAGQASTERPVAAERRSGGGGWAEKAKEWGAPVVTLKLAPADGGTTGDAAPTQQGLDELHLEWAAVPGPEALMLQGLRVTGRGPGSGGMRLFGGGGTVGQPSLDGLARTPGGGQPGLANAAGVVDVDLHLRIALPDMPAQVLPLKLRPGAPAALRLLPGHPFNDNPGAAAARSDAAAAPACHEGPLQPACVMNGELLPEFQVPGPEALMLQGLRVTGRGPGSGGMRLFGGGGTVGQPSLDGLARTPGGGQPGLANAAGVVDVDLHLRIALPDMPAQVLPLKLRPGAPAALRLLPGHPFNDNPGAAAARSDAAAAPACHEGPLQPACVMNGELLPEFQVRLVDAWGNATAPTPDLPTTLELEAEGTLQPGRSTVEVDAQGVAELRGLRAAAADAEHIGVRQVKPGVSPACGTTWERVAVAAGADTSAAPSAAVRPPFGAQDVRLSIRCSARGSGARAALELATAAAASAMVAAAEAEGAAPSDCSLGWSYLLLPVAIQPCTLPAGLQILYRGQPCEVGPNAAGDGMAALLSDVAAGSSLSGLELAFLDEGGRPAEPGFKGKLQLSWCRGSKKVTIGAAQARLPLPVLPVRETIGDQPLSAWVRFVGEGPLLAGLSLETSLELSVTAGPPASWRLSVVEWDGAANGGGGGGGPSQVTENLGLVACGAAVCLEVEVVDAHGNRWGKGGREAGGGALELNMATNAVVLGDAGHAAKVTVAGSNKAKASKGCAVFRDVKLEGLPGTYTLRVASASRKVSLREATLEVLVVAHNVVRHVALVPCSLPEEPLEPGCGLELMVQVTTEDDAPLSYEAAVAGLTLRLKTPTAEAAAAARGDTAAGISGTLATAEAAGAGGSSAAACSVVLQPQPPDEGASAASRGLWTFVAPGALVVAGDYSVTAEYLELRPELTRALSKAEQCARSVSHMLQVLPGPPVRASLEHQDSARGSTSASAPGASGAPFSVTNGADGRGRALLSSAAVQLRDEYGNAASLDGVAVRWVLGWAEGGGGGEREEGREERPGPEELVAAGAELPALQGSSSDAPCVLEALTDSRGRAFFRDVALAEGSGRVGAGTAGASGSGQVVQQAEKELEQFRRRAGGGAASTLQSSSQAREALQRLREEQQRAATGGQQRRDAVTAKFGSSTSGIAMALNRCLAAPEGQGEVVGVGAQLATVDNRQLSAVMAAAFPQTLQLLMVRTYECVKRLRAMLSANGCTLPSMLPTNMMQGFQAEGRALADAVAATRMSPEAAELHAAACDGVDPALPMALPHTRALLNMPPGRACTDRQRVRAAAAAGVPAATEWPPGCLGYAVNLLRPLVPNHRPTIWYSQLSRTLVFQTQDQAAKYRKDVVETLNAPGLGDVLSLDGGKLSGRGVVMGSSFRVVPVEEAQTRFGASTSNTAALARQLAQQASELEAVAEALAAVEVAAAAEAEAEQAVAEAVQRLQASHSEVAEEVAGLDAEIARLAGGPVGAGAGGGAGAPVGGRQRGGGRGSKR
ncbi:Structural maintenance of chromosomes flexible hinge domain-containing protein 1 [Tetrabaena socialis]|uniref:Structural maintenance of chromosomes flexible hinge domain-containing protein 1 n=1 Tax=Tetrabaena socialis TaxID=47790 RepID=A0A2J7ZQP5_9CHLO|nr:Structural maintenance of chromosomes flexible hinge domain-containing protein 1 [Tetrabaena socialis]|eukprot:PNH02580.1 Structural maintenance of chromosomes flexible hinge domain-containing protein 1 [Tetrabaena socialis]